MMYGYGHPNPYGYGYGFGYRHHFNPFGAICFSLFFLFFFFGFMKMIFFRRMRHGGHHKHGPWGKGWEDGEFEITDFQRTTGEKGNAGFQITCVTKAGKTFNVGSGLSHAEQDYYAQNSPVGQLLKLRFEMLSDTGIPLKPTIEAILE